MNFFFQAFFLVLLFSSTALAGDWLEWRGPTRNGHADPREKPPLHWSENKNVLWKAKVPGTGHSSPTVVGDLIILTSAHEPSQKQAVLAYDRNTGVQKWSTTVLTGDFPKKIHKKNTHASPTAVSDGSSIYVVFFNGVSVYLTALDLQGTQLWQIKTGEFHSRFPFGYAPSPILHGDTVIVTSEYERGGFIAAFRKSDGKQVWTTPRNEGTSYSTPVIATVSGKEQLFISGFSHVSNEQGTTYVFKPDPSRYHEVAQNQLGESGFATPSFVSNRIYVRTAFDRSNNEGYLYCVGAKN